MPSPHLVRGAPHSGSTGQQHADVFKTTHNSGFNEHRHGTSAVNDSVLHFSNIRAVDTTNSKDTNFLYVSSLYDPNLDAPVYPT